MEQRFKPFCAPLAYIWSSSQATVWSPHIALSQDGEDHKYWPWFATMIFNMITISDLLKCIFSNLYLLILYIYIPWSLPSRQRNGERFSNKRFERNGSRVWSVTERFEIGNMIPIANGTLHFKMGKNGFNICQILYFGHVVWYFLFIHRHCGKQILLTRIKV